MSDYQPHSGHRERMRQKFRESGLSSFQPHEVLEYLLFFSIPRGDTNMLAHDLLTHFGSLDNLFEASYEELTAVKGVGDKTASLISLMGPLFRKYSVDKHTIKKQLMSPDDWCPYICSHFMGLKDETVVLLCLNNRYEALDCSIVFQGSVNAAEINVRRILQQALRFNATAVIIAHNHPSGFATPSRADLDTTRVIAKSLSMADITLLDHVIVAKDDCISMRDTPTLAPYLHS